MAAYPQLARPPIAEALLDLRTRLPAGVKVEDLDAVGLAIKDDYPDARPIHSGQAQIGFDPTSPTAAATVDKLGAIYWTTDGSRAVQARLDGFTVNWTSGYRDFEGLVEMARSAWAHFASAARPELITRVALRYINRIPLSQGVDLDDVLQTGPRLGAGLGSAVEDLFMRVVVPFGDGRRGVITEALSEGSMILDIDVFSTRDIPPDGEALWGELARLRELKNKCFFHSLTQRTLESFNEG